MNKRQETFVETVWEFYERHGRRSLPWRQTKLPYRILVSEIMLQQTQVERVLPKYKSFLKQFPTARALAAVPLGEVLREWQGLGYNRRAKMLHMAAKEIVETFHGTFPRTFESVRQLPGVGNYTAGAIMAFAYNVPVPMIETNIRAAYLHHFFTDDTDVPDTEILKLVIETLDLDRPREWYAALMDYGSYIKKTRGNPNSRSRHYVQQSAFKGSDREIRGAIIRALGQKRITRESLHATLPFEIVRIDAQLERLTKEGMIAYQRGKYFLPV